LLPDAPDLLLRHLLAKSAAGDQLRRIAGHQMHERECKQGNAQGDKRKNAESF
jgi:hypothetical protein